ncbi:MAG: transporter substrate-binding domain-containing protein [Firmicutes bacterium]|nr:transporter substrate-binding domain-containing protein [Bacillota bacterium]
MKKRQLLPLLLAALLCLALFSACGTANGGSPSAAAQSDYAYVMGNKTLNIGYTVFAPMNYTDDNGNFTGFDTEFARAVCAKLGVTPNFVEINWDTKEVELNAKTIDCIWNGMTILPERAAAMSITIPYARNAQVLVVRADSNITSTADLVGKRVVAEIGSSGEAMIIGAEGSDPEPNLAKSDYLGMAKQTDCLVEVKAGTADAAVLDMTLANAMVGPGTNFSDLKMVANLYLDDQLYGIAFRKGSDLTEQVNAIMLELVKDGTLPALAEKYGLTLAPELLTAAQG